MTAVELSTAPTTTMATAENDPPSESLPTSPHAMAEAVLAEAMVVAENRDRRAQEEASKRSSNDDEHEEASGAAKRARLTKTTYNENIMTSDAALEKLKEAWEGPDGSTEKAMESTLALIQSQIESLIRKGLQVHHAHESKSNELILVKDELESKDRELQRLRSSEEQSRTTITNLLRAVETAKSDARDATRRVQAEARLRADLAALRGERNEAVGSAATFQRQASLLEEDLRAVKAKLHRVSQEKIKMERDSRAALSLARSMDSHTSSDCDFYKRKVSELTGQLQTQQALVAEQKHQMEEMRRQMERSMSQNRLANIRAEQNGKQGRKRAH